MQFHVLNEDVMTVGDYHAYIAALADLDMCARLARRNPANAKALRHKASATLAQLAARYEVSSYAE